MLQIRRFIYCRKNRITLHDKPRFFFSRRRLLNYLSIFCHQGNFLLLQTYIEWEKYTKYLLLLVGSWNRLSWWSRPLIALVSRLGANNTHLGIWVILGMLLYRRQQNRRYTRVWLEKVVYKHEILRKFYVAN